MTLEQIIKKQKNKKKKNNLHVNINLNFWIVYTILLGVI